MSRTRSGAAALAVLSCFFIGYCAAGYAYLRTRTTIWLAYYAIYPGDIGPGWRLIPDVSDLAQWILARRSAAELRQPFTDLPGTLYTATVGFRKDRPLTEEERKRAKELAVTFYRAGVPVGAELEGPAGCSAVHQAVIQGDAWAANFLLSLGSLRNIPGNPKASFPGCDEDVITFARLRGVALKPDGSQ